MPVTNQLAVLPAHSGVYLFKNERGDILYVGKAKSLRRRVRSYFRLVKNKPAHIIPNPDMDLNKQYMVKKIASVDTITTDTEIEALVLEANLIHQHQPPYNVLLRDDKFYLFIKITTNENPPRVFPVRQLKRDGARYFGPYSSASSVRQTLLLLRRIFPCHPEKESPRDQTFPHPLFAPGAKSAPHSPEHNEGDRGLLFNSSQENISSIIRFLRGDRTSIITTLRRGMLQASRQKKFEQAAIFRDQLRAIERLEGSQKVYLPRRESFDVISLVRQTQTSAANIFSVRHGKLLNKNTFLLRHPAAAPAADLVRQFILQYYQVAQDIPKLILIPHQIKDLKAIAQTINSTAPPTFAIPQRGPKKQLLIMGELNAKQFLTQQTATFTSLAQTRRALRELSALIFSLPVKDKSLPILSRIETYDVSNLQGRLATGSMIVFSHGQPNKNQYRKFKIKLHEEPNDYAMLQEVLSRRFSKQRPDWPLPDLILIDGGRGQLNVAKRVLNQLHLDLPVAALAKRIETLHFFSPPTTSPEAPTSPPQTIATVNLPFDSPTLFLLQQMRDEAHRFTITYHRLLRSHQHTHSLLDDIPQLGPKTKRKLLRHFGSLQAIRAANNDELIQVIGQAKTNLLRDWL